MFLWRCDRRARLLWDSVIAALCGAVWFTARTPHFDQNSLSTYNRIGIVTIEGVISGPPDVRDAYINLRVNTDRLTTPDRSSRPIKGVVLVALTSRRISLRRSRLSASHPNHKLRD